MRPSTIVIAVIVIVAGAAQAWLVMSSCATDPAQTEVSHNSFKPPQDYKLSGGQQMKPRW